MAVPLNPTHPERVCWGCDKYCPAEDLACGNGTIRTAHPAELFGDDWLQWASTRTSRKTDSHMTPVIPPPVRLDQHDGEAALAVSLRRASRAKGAQ